MQNVHLLFAITLATDIKGIELRISPYAQYNPTSSLKNQYVIGSIENPYHLQFIDPRLQIHKKM